MDIKRKIWTNQKIDYTIIEILRVDNIQNFLTIDENIIGHFCQNNQYKNDSILLPTFIQNGEFETGKGNIKFIEKNGYLFINNCNTDEGSSGGRVIFIDNFAVIDIHKGYLKKIINKKFLLL